MQHSKFFAGLPRSWRLVDRPLSVQFWVAGGVVAISSVISLTVLLHQVRGQTEAFRNLGRTQVTISQLDNLSNTFHRQRVAIFDYMSTRDRHYLDTIGQSRKEWGEIFQSVQSLVGNSARQVEYFKSLDKSYQAWLLLSERFIRNPRTVTPADLRLESAQLKDTLLSIDRILNSQHRLLSLDVENEKYESGSTLLSIALINVMLLVVFGTVLTQLYYSIARPLSDLLNAIVKYKQGEFSIRVPVTNSGTVGFIEASFNEMAEKFEAMVADLRKLDVLKTEFISTVSHELRTPLTSIGGYTKLFLAGDTGPLSDLQKEFLAIIDMNVVRLNRLINEILDIEALEENKLELHRHPLDLSPILKECMDTFQIVAQQKGLEVRYSVPSSLKPILGERARSIQIFMNLISNAIKYTQSGFVEVYAEQTDIAVIVRIRDSGVGLSLEDQEKLFQKFYRARSALTSAESGTGLGLVIVRKLVELFGGKISVNSELNHGTQFTVTFPLMDALN